MLYIDDVGVVADADDAGHVGDVGDVGGDDVDDLGDVEGFVDEVRSRWNWPQVFGRKSRKSFR